MGLVGPSSLCQKQCIHDSLLGEHTETAVPDPVRLLLNPAFFTFTWPGNSTSCFVKGHQKELLPQNFCFKGWTSGLSVELWHWQGWWGRQAAGGSGE